MQEAIKDVDEPWGAHAALKEVEAQCAHVSVSELARGRALFLLITSTLLAMLLIDVDNSDSMQHSTSAGSAIATISFAFTLVLLTSIYNKYTVYTNSKRITGGRNGSAGQPEKGIEMCEIKIVSGDELKNGSTINPMLGSAITEDEIPSAY